MNFIKITKRDKNNKRFGLYLCDCGKETEHRIDDVIRGKISGCKECKRIIQQNNSTKHGENGTKLHIVWVGMRQRCNNPKSFSYHNYGGRGISICNEWSDYLTFKEWATSTGYKPNLSIDRINNDGNYEPSNCHWTTAKEQSNNQRKRKNTSSKYEGVSFKTANNKWQAQYKGVYVGIFKKEEQANDAIIAFKMLHDDALMDAENVS